MRGLMLSATRKESAWHDPVLSWQECDCSPGDYDVVVQVKACGVCGTDVHCVSTTDDGRIVFSGPLSPPIVLGHEFSGQIVHTGKCVSTLQVNDWVVCESIVGCGLCLWCRGGRPNQCENIALFGLTRNGAFADLVVVPERCCWSIDKICEHAGNVRDACVSASLIEPFGCVYNGVFVEDRSFSPGQHVVIYGAGAIGLSAVILLRLAGAATITVVEPISIRRELARSLGADRAISPTDDIHMEVMETTNGHGADLQIECAGAIVSLITCIELNLAPCGRILYLARTGERVPLSLDRYVTLASRVVGSRGQSGGHCIPRLIDLLCGRIDVGPMITHRFELTEAHEAILKAQKRDCGKVIVVNE